MVQATLLGSFPFPACPDVPQSSWVWLQIPPWYLNDICSARALKPLVTSLVWEDTGWLTNSLFETGHQQCGECVYLATELRKEVARGFQKKVLLLTQLLRQWWNTHWQWRKCFKIELVDFLNQQRVQYTQFFKDQDTDTQKDSPPSKTCR